MRSTSDSDLLLRYRAKRSERAFAALVVRYQGMVLGTAFRRTGSLETAQDVTQRVFAVLARKSALLIGRTSLAGWLHHATVYESIRAAQSEARLRAREVPFADEVEYTIPAPAPALVTPERWVALEDAIDSLAAPDREMLVLHYFQDLSYEEMALKLGVNQPAVRKRVSRALARLGVEMRSRGVTGNATAMLAAAVAIQSSLLAPAGLAHAALAAAGAGAGASSFLTLSALLSAPPVKTLATILALISLPGVWFATVSHDRGQARAAVEIVAVERRPDAPAHTPVPPSQAAGVPDAVAAEHMAAPALPALASPEPIRRPSAFAVESGPAPARRVAARIPRPSPPLVSPRRTNFAGIDPALTPVTVRITRTSPAAAGTPPSPEAPAQPSPEAPAPTSPGPLSEIANIERHPAEAAAFLGDVLDEALALAPLDKLLLTDFLDGQFERLNADGLAGIRPPEIIGEVWQALRAPAIAGIVEGVQELLPDAPSAPALVEAVLSLAEQTASAVIPPPVAEEIAPAVIQPVATAEQVATALVAKVPALPAAKLVPVIAQKLPLLH